MWWPRWARLAAKEGDARSKTRTSVIFPLQPTSFAPPWARTGRLRSQSLRSDYRRDASLTCVYSVFTQLWQIHVESGTVDRRSTLGVARELASSHLITSCAALAALFVFMPIGQRIIAGVFDRSSSLPIDNQLTVAFLLNIAVILFAWRRSKDLQAALAANEAAQQSAHDSAFVDHVTGLANRRELMRVLPDDDLRGKGSTLLLLDLDFFKKVNDLYGHVVGDEVLKNVAKVIQSCAPEGSCCARLGGDEFAVLVPPLGDRVVSKSVAAIIRSIAEPLPLGTATVHVSASVGISRIEPGKTAEECLRRSDIAMYSAKRAGRNCSIWFDSNMEQELIARTKLEDEIRSAVEAGEFIPFYQPQMDLGTGELTGFEVLARWNSPAKGLLEPA